MMIFLSALKIIGIVLLCILSFLLLLILAVLFIPVRYRLSGRADSDRGYYLAELCVTWLLHFVKGRAWFKKEEGEEEEENPGFELRILGIKLFPGRTKDGEETEGIRGEEPVSREIPEAGEETGTRERTDEAGEADSPYTEEAGNGEGNFSDPEEEDETGEGDSWASEEEDETREGNFSDPKEEDENGKKPGIGEKIREFAGFLRRLPRNIHHIKTNARYEIKEKYDKIKRLYYRAGHYYDTIESERFNEALSLALNELLRILKALKPKGYRISLTYGLEDPALTGEITGLIAVLFPPSGKEMALDPDFDRQVLTGQGFIKGRIRLVTVLIVLWKLYFNKNIRWTVRELKK